MNSLRQLPKDKRNQLLLVVLITAAALAAVFLGLIRLQADRIRRIQSDTQEAQNKLTQMQQRIRTADQLEQSLADAAQQLATLEDAMAAPQDQYAWILNTIRRFTLPYKIEIPVVNQPVPGETSLLPKFPYQQASVSLSGTGHYHDIGRFLADLENQFPHFRLVNLSLDPVSSLIPDVKEVLEFKLELVVLIRPNPS
jgi:Tfp pilus assembly protein PilO